METAFYDDSFLSSAYAHPDGSLLHDHVKYLKQNMSVSFAEPFYRSYKTHASQADADSSLFFANTDAADSVAPSSLRLAAPELERLINITGNGVIATTPTPSAPAHLNLHHAQQEGFVDGFVKALDDMHKSNQLPPPNVSLSGGLCPVSVPSSTSAFAAAAPTDGPVYTTLGSCSALANTNLPPVTHASYPTTTISYLPHAPHTGSHQHAHAHYTHQQQQQSHAPHHPHHHPYHQHALATVTGAHHHTAAAAALHAQRFVALKEEPQTVPDLHSSSDGGSPPMSPVDMEDQERAKAERKRLRNRLAATKCRKRKLERIARLEDKVKVLKTDNAGLSRAATVLREQVATLKGKVMKHVSSGCQLAHQAQAHRTQDPVMLMR